MSGELRARGSPCGGAVSACGSGLCLWGACLLVGVLSDPISFDATLSAPRARETGRASCSGPLESAAAEQPSSRSCTRSAGRAGAGARFDSSSCESPHPPRGPEKPAVTGSRHPVLSAHSPRSAGGMDSGCFCGLLVTCPCVLLT